MKPLAILTIVFTALDFCQIFASTYSFYANHEKGWHWYEVQPIEKEAETESKETAQVMLQSKPKTAKEVVDAYKQELENRLAAAWINPTQKNIQNYQEMQKDMMDRSKSFSDGWMQSVFSSPALDHTIVSPVNQKARHVQLDLEKKHTTEIISSLSTDYGLFFFFSGHCDYCHGFAPIVKAFSEKYGWQVLAITLDGGPLEEFPNAQPDNGLFQQWNVQVLPALYAVNPNTGHVIPVAHGMTSIDEMENRVISMVRQQ